LSLENLINQAQELSIDQPDEALRIISNVLNQSPNEARAIFLCASIFMHAERYGLAYNLLKPPVHAMPILGLFPKLSSNTRHCILRSGSAIRYGLPLNDSSERLK